MLIRFKNTSNATRGQKLIKLLSITLLTGFLIACEECPECLDFKRETFVKVKFFGIDDEQARSVIIDSVNHEWAKTFRFFQDTTDLYKFPISMNEDSSSIDLIFRDLNDLTTYHSNNIEVVYSRDLVKNDDNYVVMHSFVKQIMTNFDKFETVCSDTLTTSCLSNETTIKVFF